MSSPLLDLATRLQDEGVGTIGTNIFIGGRPATPDDCVTLQTYPGDENRIRGDTNVPADERWAIQVTARAAGQDTAESLAAAAFTAIQFRYQTLTSGRRYSWCRAYGMPAFIGKDQNARALVGFNVTLRRDNTQNLT